MDVFLGLIIETEIISSEDSRFFQASLEQHVKPVRNMCVHADMNMLAHAHMHAGTCVFVCVCI